MNIESNIKLYTINIVEKKSSYNYKKLFEIIYYDNSKKTIENLKEYIYELSNYSFCPCILKIHKTDYYKINWRNVFDDTNDKLLCESDLPDSFCISVDYKLICRCTTFFKERFKLSKSNIIKDEIEKKENYEKLEKENKNYINLKKDYESAERTISNLKI